MIICHQIHIVLLVFCSVLSLLFGSSIYNCLCRPAVWIVKEGQRWRYKNGKSSYGSSPRVRDGGVQERQVFLNMMVHSHCHELWVLPKLLFNQNQLWPAWAAPKGEASQSQQGLGPNCCEQTARGVWVLTLLLSFAGAWVSWPFLQICHHWRFSQYVLHDRCKSFCMKKQSWRGRPNDFHSPLWNLDYIMFYWKWFHK